MSFQWAALLWLLILVPLLVLAYLWMQRRRRRYAARFASLMVVSDALGKGPGFRRHLPALLFLVGITVGLVALARPSTTIFLPSSHGTVILVLDMSGSMRARDITPTRFDAAKEAARAFIEKQPRTVKIGIVAFSSTAALVQPPTASREDLVAAMDRLQLQRGTAVGGGIVVALGTIFEGTPQAAELQAAAQALRSPFGGRGGFGGQFPDQFGAPPASTQQAPDQPLAPAPDATQPVPLAPGAYTSAVIVLLTDGQSNTGPDPLEAADLAANMGVRIYTVGIGTTQGDTVGAEGRIFRVQLDEDTLKKIAQNTAGSYYKASNESDLVRIYQALSVRLTMEKDTTEVTAVFTALALALFLLGSGLSLAWFSRVS
jgi:Ca-activated chloride channel family protein